MTGGGEHASEQWRGIDALVAAYAGTASGYDAFRGALHALERALPATRLWLLRPAEAPIAISSISCAAERRPSSSGGSGGVIEYPLSSLEPAADDAARAATWRTVGALAACGAQAALVFAENGIAPYAPAYLCYLAGIAYRAGYESEFGGAVLAPAFRQPQLSSDRERHLALLTAVGLDAGCGARITPPPAPASTNRSIACER